MKKLVYIPLLICFTLSLIGCNKNPEDKLLDKEYYVEYQSEPDSEKDIEITIFFGNDGIVKTKSTQLTSLEDVASYEIGDELINDKYYLLKTNVGGLNCSDEFLYDPEEMILYVYDEDNGDYKPRDSCVHKLVEK
ncbi:hypothetical protein [Nosocomiicoccus sp. HMSC09A07]|uniref:hypothetical protein n=1 Tax=Nosocomiicoccus sp. HMSC09A07 TaxID=1581145 RepID=UPI0008A1B55C|nr:hypothetical protein [Nosocomiicoccus sp. HMSC09A07]OFS63399.1 hypothetical protein HMPREF3177_03115 [Nosocomiicoccus sp. HMSC09A07]